MEEINLKEQLHQEIARIPKPLLSQLLDSTVFIKARYAEENAFK